MSEPTKENLQTFSKQLDARKHAWEAESVHQPIAVFDEYEEDVCLHEVVNDIVGRVENAISGF